MQNLIGFPAEQPWYTLDTVQKWPLGQVASGVDSFWGGGEWMYVKFTATVRQYGIVNIKGVFNATTNQWEISATEVPNTANLAYALGIAMLAATVGQYGWVQIGGVVPVNCQASVAADTTFGIAAAGQGGANSAGKQILNARIMAAGATTVAKAGATGNAGSTLINVPNSDGWFIGAYLSGTGVGASTIVTGISPDGRQVSVSVANSAAINGTVTATYNNATIFYNVAYINRPFAQGAIT
jgi:hypothetical protein